ncbi:hypothetical protein OSCI_3400049 [Kamptonema sp. PCC 6506]|nr:hypothetical protein OSCI_3400049 [Kamptonema sp. PCC 6506]
MWGRIDNLEKLGLTLTWSEEYRVVTVWLNVIYQRLAAKLKKVGKFN